MTRPELALRLEALYETYNRREFIHPDPLEFVYRYAGNRDREVAGLVAAGLAFGRVAHILANVGAALAPLGQNPAAFLCGAAPASLEPLYRGFRHRWTSSEELVSLLYGIGRVLRDRGTLEACFAAHTGDGPIAVRSGLSGLVAELGGPSSLLSDPAKSSACKRLHLYLRWMVRNDDIDPGCWTSVNPAELVVPLDTHLHRVARGLRLTRRKQADLNTAMEVTRAFRRIVPNDPLRYDFTLTRFGIRPELDMGEFLAGMRR